MNRYIGRLNSLKGRSGTLREKGPAAAGRQEIAQLSEQLEYMEDFLSLNLRRPGSLMARLSEALENGYRLWAGMAGRAPQNEAAKAVIAAFDQSGGIRDLIEEQRRFADEAEGFSDGSEACRLGYNSHMFYLRSETEKLVAGRERILDASAEIPLGAEGNARFIGEECQHVAAVCDIPKRWYDGRKLLEDMRAGKPMTQSQWRRFGEVFQAADLLRSDPAAAAEEINQLCAGLRIRMDAMDANIRRGSVLYDFLVKYLTEAWFSTFDPDSPSCGMAGMTAGEVGEFYRTQTEELTAHLPARGSAG